MKYWKLSEANIARDREWNTTGKKLPLSFRGTELAGECGEACNVIKKLERERLGLVGSRDTVEHLADELADVVISAYLVAMDENINLDRVIAEKFNETSRKNGFKTMMNVADEQRTTRSTETPRNPEAGTAQGIKET